MAVHSLCSAFRRLAFNKQFAIITRHASTEAAALNFQRTNLPVNSSFPNCSPNSAKCLEVSLRFLPGSLSIDFGVPYSGVTKIIESPLNHIPSMEEPAVPKPLLEDIPFSDKSLELPTTNTFDKHAVTLIRIRRKKMQKHKRRKLRKKMKFVWAKDRAKRHQLRDKRFKEELLAKVMKAVNFDAKAYVDSRIAAYTKKRLPYTWRGEILPQAQIEEFVKEKARREHAKRNVPRLKL